MEAATKSDEGITSVAAFVDGGVQEACEDACSICLEEISQSDPSTVTNCRHDFHLHCILEWCRRSSNCPMCWQPISLKDAESQELLDAVEQERKLKSDTSSNAEALRHPTGNLGLQHLTLAATEAEFERRIIQHLAAAAAMRRGSRRSLRDGQRNRSSSGADPIFILTAPGSTRGTVVGGFSPRRSSMQRPNSPGGQELPLSYSPVRSEQSPNRTGSNFSFANRLGFLSESRSFGGQSSPQSQDTAGLLDVQSLSDSLRSRFSTWSMRYKESFSRSTRDWKEKLLTRCSSSTNLSLEVQRDVSAQFASTYGSSDSPRRSNSQKPDQATRGSHSKLPTCASSSASD